MLAGRNTYKDPVGGTWGILNQTPILGAGGLRPELLDPMPDLDAVKCTHISCRPQLHAAILFLSIRPLITHAEMPFGQASKSNTEKHNHMDLIFKKLNLKFI